VIDGSSKIKVKLNPEINLEGDEVTIAVDTTGIKASNRGERI
jgi:hypothetical protein